MKNLYNVHYMGFYGYNIQVVADTEEEAHDIADRIWDEIPVTEYDFEPNGESIISENVREGDEAVMEINGKVADVVYEDGEWVEEQ